VASQPPITLHLQPALRPTLHPAFKVRRGERSLCAAVSVYVQPIRRGSPCDFYMPSACIASGDRFHFNQTHPLGGAGNLQLSEYL
jgi:hypothetical protein